MNYHEYEPPVSLKAYVKCFYVIEFDTDIVAQDQAFATGCMEIMFNLGGVLETGRDGKLVRTPQIELWGQIIKPLTFRSLGKSKLLGIRFHPHTAALFLQAPINLFNDAVNDYTDVAGPEVKRLHERLKNTPSLTEQLALLETFLLGRLHLSEKKHNRFSIVNNVIADVTRDDFFDNMEGVAARYGISTRYLQKLFVEFTGISPKLYHKINRFQKSLLLTGKGEESLTSVTYMAGYFDQSHFVRDFKFFTGSPPSELNTKSTALLVG